MAVPANRAKIRLVRGTYANILAGIADLVDGELCYAKDQNKLYMVEETSLTPLDYLQLEDVEEAVQDAIAEALAGGTGIEIDYNDEENTITVTLADTEVTAGEYGSSTEIPVLTIDQQGRITVASTASISTTLSVAADGETSDSIELADDILTISGGTGLTSSVENKTVVIDLDDTGVTAGSYGSTTEIPVITVDGQGRITEASTSTISTSLSVLGDEGEETVELGDESLSILGGTGISTSAADDAVTIDLDDTAVTPAAYGAADSVASFTVDQQGRITDASDIAIAITHEAVTDFNEAVRESAGLDQTFEPMGFANRLDSAISFNSATRVFEIEPVADSYDIWVKGIKYTITEPLTATVTDVTGIYYISFGSTGSLQIKNVYFDWESDAPIAFIYWNATTQTAPFFADERHGITMDWATHEYLHRTRGAAFANGFSISNFNTTGDGSLDSHAQIDLGGGTFFDEDLEINVLHRNDPTPNTWEQDLQGPARIPAFYLIGTEWYKDAATDFPLKQGTLRPQYNLLSGGSWSTADVGENRYFNIYITATNNLNEPVIAIIGQEEHVNIGSAQASQFSSLTLTQFPTTEFRPLYKLTFQAGNYGNSVNARLREVSDIRGIQAVGGTSGIASDHGLLSGLGDDDHLQYLHVTEDRTGVTANISTTGTLKTTNSTASTSSATGALVVSGGAGIGGDLFVDGNLTISGDTVTINAETIVVEDKNIQLGTVSSPSDATADGGGITLLGSTNKTINWLDATDSWTFSENIDIANTKAYYINGQSVLSSTALGAGVISSSLTSVGTITTGTWNGSTIGTAYGGTGLTSYTQGQLLVGTSTGGLAASTLTEGANISVTNGDGSITISATDTTYTAGDGLNLSGTEFSAALKANGGLVIESNNIAVDLGASSITGTLAVADGGTGVGTITKGSILVSNEENVLSALDGGGMSDGILVYDSASDIISWATEIDGGSY